MAYVQHKMSSLNNIESMYGNYISEASKKYGVDRDILLVMANQESSGKKNAVSNKGASGIMQIMPNTFKELDGGKGGDIFDPKTSIMYGAKHFSSLLKQNKGNVSLALAAYNAGQGNVDKFGGIPNFQETQEYVGSIVPAIDWYKRNKSLPPEKQEVVSPAQQSWSLKFNREQRDRDRASFEKQKQTSLSVSKVGVFSSEWISANWEAFKQASPITQAIDETYARSVSKPDSNYTFSANQVSGDFQKLGLSYDETTLDFMSKSQSMDDYSNRLETIRRNTEIQNNILQKISASSWYSAYNVSSMAGAVVGDPSTYLSFYALPKAIVKTGLASRALTSFGSAGAIQTGIALVKDDLIAGYDSSDVAMDIILGTAIDGTFARGMYKPKTAPLTPNVSTDITVRASSMASVNPNLKGAVTSQNYTWYSSPKMRIEEQFTDVEFFDHAKKLGYDSNDVKLIEDKDIRRQVAKSIEDEKATIANEDIRYLQQQTYSDVKDLRQSYNKKEKKPQQLKVGDSNIDEATKLYNERVKKSGLTSYEFDKRVSSLESDVNEISSLIDEVTSYGASKTKKKFIKDLEKSIDEIYRVSQSAGDMLKYKLNKLSGVNKATKAVMTKDGKIAFAKGKKSYDSILKSIDTHISKTINKISKISDDINANKKAGEKLTPNDAKSVIDSLGRQKEMFQRMKSALDELSHNFGKALDGIILNSFISDLERTKYLDELSDAINTEFGSNVKIEWKNNKISWSGEAEFTSNGRYATNKKSPHKLMIATAGAMSIAVASAMASDGEDDSPLTFIIPAIMLLALARAGAGTIMTRLTKNKDMAEAAKSFTKDIEDAEAIAEIKSDPWYKKVSNMISGVTIDSFRTGYLEPMVYLKRNMPAKNYEIVSKMVRDWIDGHHVTVDSSKLQLVRSAETRLAEVERETYSNWLIKNSVQETIGDKFLSSLVESKYKEKFNELVTDYIENGIEADEFVKKYADAVKKERDIVSARANTYELPGFEDDKYSNFKDSYMSRYIKSPNWNKILSAEGGREALANAISNMIGSAIKTNNDATRLLDVAYKYIDIVTKTHLTHGAINAIDIDAIIKAMDDLGLDTSSIDADAIAKEAHRGEDVIGRGKARIPMNTSEFKPFVIKVDGADFVVELGTLFERNATNITRRYMNQMYGATEMSRITGYKSSAALLNDLSKGVTDQESIIKIKTFVDSIYGNPTLDMSSEFSQNIMALKGASNMVLGLSVLSTIPEIAKVFGAAYLGKGSSKLARRQLLYATGNLIKGMFGKESFKKTWLATIMTRDVNGLGGAIMRGDIDLKAIDDIMNIDDLSVGTVRDIAKKSGLRVLLMSRLIHADDMFKNMANIYAATNLARVANGKTIWDDGKKAMYGITDDAISRLKTFLKIDESDEVLGFDYDSLPQSDKDIFNTIVDRIVMDRSTWTTLGATPTGSINNTAGVLLSSLTHFMAQIYTTQFIAKAKYGGISNMSDMALWVVSGYASYYARSYATGREPDEEDALMYALMSSPIASPINIANMMIDPIALSIVSRAVEGINASADYALEGTDD